MKTMIITLSALAATLAAVPALAGPPSGATFNGVGVAATAWLHAPAREMRPYALVGREDRRDRPIARDTVRVGPGRVVFETYRR
jgi:hypothetical protein